MNGIYQAWQTGLLWVCLCALGAMAAWLFLAKVAAPAWDALCRWWSLPCIQRVIVGVCVVGLSYYGATKQGWHVAYDGGIKAGATANVVTNNTVAIYWQRDTSGGVYVPETATVYIDYRPNTETNAEWGLLAQTTVGAWGWSGTVENATNYDYNVWAYYIPPEPVHTNGVWTYKTHFDRNGEYVLPLRARVEVNGVAIATPKEKRKDAERVPYDSEVEYLESTGTQFIKTGFTMTDTTSYKGRIMPTGLQFNSGMFGYRFVDSATAYGNMRFSFIYSDGRIGLRNGLDVQNSTKKVVVGSLYNIEVDNQSVRLNDSVWINADNKKVAMTPPGEVWLFFVNCTGHYNIDVQHPVCMRLYSWQIFDNGIIVRDYIPVRVGTTGELYDRVSRTFATRHGTFNYGNDK